MAVGETQRQGLAGEPAADDENVELTQVIRFHAAIEYITLPGN
jgi:hypothetical protein